MDAPELAPPRSAQQQSKPAPVKNKRETQQSPNPKPGYAPRQPRSPTSPKQPAVSDTVASPSWQKRAAAAVQRQKQLEEDIREQRVKNTSAARSWRTPQKVVPPSTAAAAMAMPTPAQAQAQAQAKGQAQGQDQGELSARKAVETQTNSGKGMCVYACLC